MSICVDAISKCAEFCPLPSAKRDLSVITHIVVHRIDVGRSPEALADFFSDSKDTGGRFPYHFFIAADGVVHQCVPLLRVAPAAKKLNSYSVQIAVDGDFRKKKPTLAQYGVLVSFIADLLAKLPRNDVQIIGHTDEAGASNDPGKICPGKFLDTKALTLAVKDAVKAERIAQLKRFCVV